MAKNEQQHVHRYSTIEIDRKIVPNHTDGLQTMERTRAVCSCGDAKPWGSWYKA
ncbi:hypothetical protein [Actinomadura sp. WMMA1423]|uniref:hypothetical protein n=1 Tax=Actinomadura sp. WMMA1423 TaxID=2591108 RepID=UPI00143DFA76|nr:hypothetical protein [Actinomadura sp. WMMA1423]